MDKICFEFGIELDDIVEAEPPSTGVEYKIDIPANRYDLLCVEGIANALAVFLQLKGAPELKRYEPEGTILETKVLSSTAGVRPYIVTAAVRNVNMTKGLYDSLIDLQEKLHHNICRKRTLVAIGVHDLDSLTPPFIYSAVKPQDIKFKPLNQQKEFVADELMEFYQKDTHLKPYLHIIKDKPLYPLVSDSKGVVLSLPPIINGDHSKVSLATKNLFIECTATDLYKAQVVLDTMVVLLSEYSDRQWETEATRVVYESTKKAHLYPSLEYRSEVVDVNEANRTVGISIEADVMAKSLSRMGLDSSVLGVDKINVKIPPTRHDIIHQCDIMEDVAISYGYSNIIPQLPPAATVAAQNSLNKLTSQLREIVAQAGFTEALTFSLCSMEDECEKLLQPRQEKEKVLARIANPKTQDFQVARNSLLPGLLKTVHANKRMQLPLQLFEISDVVTLDSQTDTGARNVRKFCAIHYNKTPAFETIHGLLDRVMQVLEVKYPEDYRLTADDDPTYFPGRCAVVEYRGKRIGKLGVLHPKVLQNFDCNMLCSAVEIEIEDFL
ncbi:unnamed protein product [Allacma fusca]|uniref:Phenylalanine--tRNA ligase beta subunit n=1 Tax=Allacma fusca TaxID=39272 RepID=A0A8J2M8H8_9HEXA|nr:unnamed protein product [Allacma fusca]